MRLTDDEVVAALLSTDTNAAAAQKLGITERTLYLRMNKGAVKPKLEKAQTQILDECLSEMRKHLREAAEITVEIMKNQAVSPQVRLNAADLLQKNFLRLSEHENILERLEQLERML